MYSSLHSNIAKIYISYSIFIIPLSYSYPDDLCINGCQLLYNPAFIECDSNEAFVPNSYPPITANDNNNDGNLDIDISTLIKRNYYICFNPRYQKLDDIQYSAYTQDGEESVFNLDSPVLIWQAIIISVVVPLLAFLLFKVVLLICNKCCELKVCASNDKCCCCLYLCSAQYRQKKRNRKFPYNNPNVNELDLDIHHGHDNNNNDNGKKWWKFNRKNSQKNNNNHLQNEKNEPIMIGNDNHIDIENEHDGIDVNHVMLQNDNNIGEDMGKGIDINEYEHLPLNEKDGDKPRNVLEEVSVDNNEMEKYLQAPGGNNQDIELSFSSQGLRQISYRDVV